MFVVVGEKHREAVVDENGDIKALEMLPLGLTLDERIADGYYYAKSIKLLKYLLENPELLEMPACTPVVYEEAKVRA